MELEKTANLRQDIVKASLIFFRKAGEELIGPQGIVFCRRHGIGKNIVKDRGDGDTQGGGDFCQSFYGDVFLPTLHLANVRGMEPGAVCQGFLAVAFFCRNCRNLRPMVCVIIERSLREKTISIISQSEQTIDLFMGLIYTISIVWTKTDF